jgi:hypothetical protein
MALDFPDNPTVGQTYGQWQWSGSQWTTETVPAGVPPGGVAYRNVSVTGSYTVPAGEGGNIFVSGLTAPATITLPTPSEPGQWFFVKDTDGAAATQAITVTGSGGKQIDDMTSYVIGYGYGAVRLEWSGVRWSVG